MLTRPHRPALNRTAHVVEIHALRFGDAERVFGVCSLEIKCVSRWGWGAYKQEQQQRRNDDPLQEKKK